VPLCYARRMTRRFRKTQAALHVTLYCLAGIALAACSNNPAGNASLPDQGVVTGTVTYNEALLLPPGALVEIRLQDVSLADVPARVLAEQLIQIQRQQFPLEFRLIFDLAAIDERHTYSVAARITVDDQLLFINTQSYPVLTRGAGDHADLMLSQVASSRTTPIVADARARAIDDRREGLRTVSGELVRGDTDADFTAWLDGDEVVLIEDIYSMGDYGKGASRFHLEDGTLFRFEKVSEQRGLNPRDRAALAPVTELIYFDGERVVASSRNVNGLAREPDATAATGAHARLDELLAATRATAGR